MGLAGEASEVLLSKISRCLLLLSLLGREINVWDEQRSVAHTANSTSVLFETHVHLLFDFFSKQDPQCLEHMLLETWIMLVQAVTTGPAISRQPGGCGLAAHLPSTPIAYGLPPASDRGAGHTSFWRQVTYPI